MNEKFKEEELLICPYNNSHRIRRNKMHIHLEKCRKGQQVKMFPCDFNAAHMVREAELRYHHQTCPDRRRIETQIVEARAATENKFPIPSVPNVEFADNWDTESAPSYDPTKYTENHEVLRHIDVESAAKRRDFRFKERQRLATTSYNKEDEASAEPPKEKVSLPPHRSVTNVTDDKYKPSSLAQKLKLDTKKVFVQNPSK